MPTLARLQVGALVLLAFACSPLASERDCADLLDVYTDKVTDQARPKTEAHQRAVLKAKAREVAARDPEFRECPRRVTVAQVRCAKSAANADEIERCLM